MLTVERMSNGRLDYLDFEDLQLGLGRRATCSASTRPTPARPTINAGAGDDRVTVEADAGATDVDGQAGRRRLLVNPIRVAGEPPVIAQGRHRRQRAASDATTVNLFGAGAARIR